MITTFYSFKGGVGRTFALVEAAAQLARRGRSVIVWDLDLEAPGMQRFPALRALDASLELGTLDLLLEFQERKYEFPERSLEKAVVELEHQRVAEAGGRLAFLLPGRLGEDYADRFNAVDWARLFAPRSGPGAAFFHAAARGLTQKLGFEHVLIDARTGYTDLGAVCTLQLPDLVVLVFNLNEQNVEGIQRVWSAVTETPARDGGKISVLAVANMVPLPFERSGIQVPGSGSLWKLQEEKVARLTAKGLKPHVFVSLRPDLLLTDAIPSLDGSAGEADEWKPVVDEIEDQRQAVDLAEEAEAADRLGRARAAADEEELEILRRRGIVERAKRFEEKVADLFRLLGYQATVDYKRDDLQFDIRLEMPAAALPSFALVECKDTERPVGQEAVREFASKVEHARRADSLPYQAILIARSRFANNAHEVARKAFVQLRTFDELLRSLVDVGPSLDRAVRGFQGSDLERLYVEQDVVFQSDIQAGRKLEPRPLTGTVLDWLDRPGGGFLLLLGDFGAGKTSFTRRLACDLALKARERQEGARAPILVDLREARSTMVSLENILASHFQTLTTLPFSPQALLHLNREGYLVLIFDGFDEMLGYSEPAHYAENLRQVLRAAEGKAKVILTCRTHFFRDRPDELKALGRVPAVASTPAATRLWNEIKDRPDAEIAYLLEFNDGQIEQYLEKALPRAEERRRFRADIKRIYHLDELARRPFLLEMIVKTLPDLAGRGKAGAVTVADLYAAYCEKWFERSEFQLTLTGERKRDLVAYLARLIWESPDTRVHYSVLAQKAAEFFKDRPFTVIEKERVDYEVRTALFLNRDAGGYYSFIHRSFLEFFVASGLRSALERGDAGALDASRLTREVAFFLENWKEAAEGIPALAFKVLSAPYQPRISENALLLHYWHALARFAPLAGGGAASSLEEQGYESLRDAFRSCRPETIQLAGARLSAVDLSGADLSGADLAGADLSSAVLRVTNLDAARLDGAALSFSDLRRTSMKRCDLSRADLNHADLRRACLEGADLRGADLSFARLVEADLRDVKAEGASWTGAGLLRATGDVESAAASRHAGPPLPRDLRLTMQLGHGGAVSSIAWDPTGEKLASGSYDNTVKLWDGASGRLLKTLEGHTNGVLSVAWDPTGEKLASGSSDNTVKLWDAASGRLLKTLEGHTNLVLSVAWDPTGEKLASGSSDNTVKLWDAASGRLLKTLEGHKNGVLSVAWDPTGEKLASGSIDASVGLFDVGSERAAPLALLYGVGTAGLAVLWDGSAAAGDPEALDLVRFSDGWALYDLSDLPERISPERVVEALRGRRRAPRARRPRRSRPQAT